MLQLFNCTYTSILSLLLIKSEIFSKKRSYFVNFSYKGGIINNQIIAYEHSSTHNPQKKHLPSLQQMQQVSSGNFVSVYKQNYLGSFAGSIAEDIGAIAFLSAIFFFFFFSLFLGLLSPMVITSNHSLP